MPYSGIFRLNLSIAIVILKVTTLEHVRNNFLTHAVNFGKGSTFSKGLWSAFPQGLSSGFFNILK